ncbi:MAG: sulfatase [Planctomycetes bacterium]|nr:sulfatase [Planctomycetota bacterium]
MARSPLRLASLALLAAAAGAGLWFAMGRRANSPRFPGAHAILLSIDTLRRDALTSYGAPPSATPALARLAADGVVVEQAIAASNYTAPSHATMLTGASPRVHGVLNTHKSSPRPIPPELPTLADRLRAAGYATYGDSDRGYVSKAFGFDRGFDTWREEQTGLRPKIDGAIRFLESLPPGKPGFVFLHTYETHAPYLPTEEELDRLSARFRDAHIAPRVLRRILRNEEADAENHGDLFEDAFHFRPEDIAFLRAVYASKVREADAAVGALHAQLSERGLLDKTVWVVTSDHGEEFKEHGSWQHQTVFDPVARVPLLVRLPGALHAGSRRDVVFPAISLAPTLLDLLGIAPPENLEGYSLASDLAGSRGAPTDAAHCVNYHSEAWVGTAVRSPRSKVIAPAPGTSGAPEAYDLAADPEEKDPQKIGSEDSKRLMVELARTLTLWEALRGRFNPPANTAPLDEQALEQLRGLGYGK